MQRTHHCPLPHRRMGLSARRYYGSTSLRAKNDRYPVSKQSCSLFQRCYAWWSCRISSRFDRFEAREGNGAMEYPSAENKLSDWFFEERNRVEGIEIVEGYWMFNAFQEIDVFLEGIGLDDSRPERARWRYDDFFRVRYAFEQYNYTRPSFIGR